MPAAKTIVQPEQIQHWPLDKLVPYAKNARTHSDAQVAQIAASIKEFGFTNPLLASADGGLLAGHGRLEAAKSLGLTSVPVVVLDHLSAKQRKAYILADNRLALNAGWDEATLREELISLDLANFEMDLLGWSAEELEDLLDPSWGDGSGEPGEGGDGEGERSDGTLQALLDITIELPRHKVEAGDHWKVGEHDLLCCSVTTGHTVYMQLLTPESIFCPYPGPFVPLGDKQDHHLVMVQPDTYIAGHLLDRYEDINGKGSTKKVSA